jgi:hypothetical protein
MPCYTALLFAPNDVDTDEASPPPPLLLLSFPSSNEVNATDAVKRVSPSRWRKGRGGLTKCMKFCCGQCAMLQLLPPWLLLVDVADACSSCEFTGRCEVGFLDKGGILEETTNDGCERDLTEVVCLEGGVFTSVFTQWRRCHRGGGCTIISRFCLSKHVLIRICEDRGKTNQQQPQKEANESSLKVLTPTLPVSPDGNIFEVLVVGTVFEMILFLPLASIT